MAERLRLMEEEAVLSEQCPFPKILMLEPTNACNLRCMFCGNSRSNRRPSMLSLKKAEQILRDAYAAGSREVGFYLTGEPLLNPFLPQMVAAARNTGYTYIFITSNGVRATREVVKNLADNGLNSLKFSINAGSRETYIKIHGVDAFQEVKKNLLDSLDLRDRSKDTGGLFHRVMISCVHMDDPDAELQAFVCEISPRVDDVAMIPAERQIKEKGFRCVLPFSRAHVTAEGRLTVCCIDHNHELVISELGGETIGEAWNGSPFRRFRRRFLERDLDGTLCGRCLYGCAEPVRPLPIPGHTGEYKGKKA